MKILVDENIPRMTVIALWDLGHDVADIRGTADQGMADDLLWEKAQREQRLLITTDKGFTQRRDERHFGTLVIRLRKPDRHKIHEQVMRAMSQVSVEAWQGLLVVMRDTVQSTWRVS